MTPNDDLYNAARSPEQWAAFEKRVSHHQPKGGWLLVLCKQDQPIDTKRLQVIAGAFGSDVYTTRQRLMATTNRPLMRFDQQSKAEEWQGWLGQLGITSFCACEKRLASQSWLPFPSLYLQDNTLIVGEPGGTPWRIPADHLNAIVFGVIEERIEERRQMVTALTENELPSETRRMDGEAIIDLHLTGRPEAIRLRQNTFHYSVLFPDETGASSVLIRRLFEMVCHAAPRAVVHNNFREAETILGNSLQLLSQDTAITMNFGRPVGAVRAERRQSVLHTNLSAFNLYSVLANLESTWGQKDAR